MATYYTDFSTDTVGQIPADSTQLSGNRFSVITDSDPTSTGGQALLLSAVNGSLSALQLSPLAASTELEIKVRVKRNVGSTGTDVDFGVRAAPSGTAAGLQGDFQPTTELRLADLRSGFSSLGQGFAFDPPDDTYHFARFYYNSATGVLKWRAWLDADPEPTTWLETLIAPDSSLNLTTVVGYRHEDVNYDWIGIGTDGDPAPSGSSVPTLAVPTNLSTSNITASSARFNWEKG